MTLLTNGEHSSIMSLQTLHNGIDMKEWYYTIMVNFVSQKFTSSRQCMYYNLVKSTVDSFNVYGQ